MAVASATELQSVASATAKLQALLDKGRTVKLSRTVEPPLPTAPFLEDVDTLHDGVGEVYDQTYKFGVVETAAREIFYSHISSVDIQDPAFVEVWNLLDILLLCGDQGQCTPELVCYLIEELLDSQTTHGCRTVFDYLESRRERLAQKDFHKKNLVFLRSCNELLRRLSRAEDSIFCGRVFFFLFQTFPLGDKSSVNLRGEFHVENTTKFEVAESESGQNGEKMDIDVEPVKVESETPKAGTPQPPSKPGSKAVPIKPPPKKEEEVLLSNSDLYPIFWRLQQDFSEPTRLFAPEHFQRFKKGLAYTITKFKKTPTVVQALAAEGSTRGTKRKLETEYETNGDLDSSSDHFADQYNPKYLTSRDLFDLELSDQSFQRHVMVQSLILIDFLLSLTEKAKKRLASLETPNKSMLYSFTLNDDDSKWATTTRQAISTYLSTTLDGKLFNRMVDTVLARDKNWIRWKVESCPSIVRGPASTQSELEARTGTKHAARLRHVSDAPKGAVDLSFLVEDSVNGLKMLKSPLRYTETTVDALLDGIDVDELDLEMEVKGSADYTQIRSRMDSKRWRIIRQARADNLAILGKVEPDKSLKSVFRPQSEPGPEEILESEDTLQVGEEVEAVSIVIQNDEPMEANVDGQESMVANGAGEESLEEPKIVAAKEVQNMEELEAVEKAWTTQAQ